MNAQTCSRSVHCVSFYRLSLCEKALADYLDIKRLAFPRFYFISSADLLDILSNGTNPHQVAAFRFFFAQNGKFYKFSMGGVKNGSLQSFSFTTDLQLSSIT